VTEPASAGTRITAPRIPAHWGWSPTPVLRLHARPPWTTPALWASRISTVASKSRDLPCRRRPQHERSTTLRSRSRSAFQTVSVARAEALADAVPSGAMGDRMTISSQFAGRAAMALVVSPLNGADMRFRRAALENSTNRLARGALVTIEFFNVDSDSAHRWRLLHPIARIANVVQGPRPFACSGTLPVAGQPVTTITFRATTPASTGTSAPSLGRPAAGMPRSPRHGS
jgi:hypothetical protein